MIVPGCSETCGTFHYLLKYYTEGDGGTEKSRRKKLTSVVTSLQEEKKRQILPFVEGIHVLPAG